MRETASRWLRWLTGCLCLAASALPLQAELTSANSAELIVTFSHAMGVDKPLLLHLAMEGDRARLAFATAPEFNRRPHDVDASRLVLEEGVLRGPVAVTINPDPWVPADGEPIACRFSLELRPDGEGWVGTYEGLRGDTEVRGPARAEAVPARAGGADARLRLRLPGALLRLYEARGPSWRYALDMDLILPMMDGQVRHAKFETPIPDYRGYSAIVQRADVQLDRSELTGTVEVMVDYGGQGTQRLGLPATELHRYTVRAVAIGQTVAGRYDVTVGESRARGVPFLGSMDTSAPPTPRESLPRLRLHGAMQNDWPVLLHLSLGHPDFVHGFAWAPRYNHQPHRIDASGLRLEGDRLIGTVQVFIEPDCYKPPERFTLHYDLDVAIQGGELSGSFRGMDRAVSTRGLVTGELRRRDAQAVPRGEHLSACELQFGWSMVGGQRPADHHLNVRFDLDAGRVVRVVPANPGDADSFAAEVTGQEWSLSGDRLAGEVRFTVHSGRVSTGQYRFRFEGMVDGNRISGLWRGTHNGNDILTKSAKLGGRLIVAEEFAGSEDAARNP